MNGNNRIALALIIEMYCSNHCFSFWWDRQDSFGHSLSIEEHYDVFRSEYPMTDFDFF